VLQSPETYDHNELLYACINVGDISAIEQILRESSSVDLSAKDYKALRKAIEFNNLEAAKQIARHPTLKITRSKFCQVLNDCLQKLKGQTNSNMVPRMPLLKQLAKELNIDVPKILANLEAKYTGGMMFGLLNALAK
jgi:hypothetical protein